MNKRIKTLIVDDEPLARSIIKRFLSDRRDIEIAGECENGHEAIHALKTREIDLIFLDIQMPEIDGFAVIDAAGGKRLPHIIFVTAYDQYAVRAFEVHAVDYLLKPFDRERFEDSLQRAVQQIRNQKDDDLKERLFNFLHEKARTTDFLERFVIKTNGRVFFLKTEEIMWIEAEANYVMLHTTAGRHLFREAISNLEGQLNPHDFRRIGRSAIVNLNYIKELQAWSRGDYKVILLNGTELKLSHHYRENLNRYLFGNL